MPLQRRPAHGERNYRYSDRNTRTICAVSPDASFARLSISCRALARWCSTDYQDADSEVMASVVEAAAEEFGRGAALIVVSRGEPGPTFTRLIVNRS
jgi:hypothetical protein